MRCCSSSASTTTRPRSGSFISGASIGGWPHGHPEEATRARGDAHAIVDTVTHDPAHGPVARDDHRPRPLARSAATPASRSASETGLVPRSPSGAKRSPAAAAADRTRVADASASTTAVAAVGPRDRRRVLDPRLEIEPSEPGPPGQRAARRARALAGGVAATRCRRARNAHDPPAAGELDRAAFAARRRRARRRLVGAPAAAAEPAAHGPARERHRRARRGGRRRARCRARATPRPARRGDRTRRASPRPAGRARRRGRGGRPLERREHLAPQPHPPVPDVVVHRVDDRREPEPGADLERVGAPEPEQRAPQVRRAARPWPRARRSRAAQQVEQHGLGLVVARVADEDARRADSAPHRFERGVPGVARARFEVRRRRRSSTRTTHGTSAPKRAAAAATTSASCDAGAQPVIDVHRGTCRDRDARTSASSASESAPPEQPTMTRPSAIVERAEPSRRTARAPARIPTRQPAMRLRSTRSSQARASSSSSSVGRHGITPHGVERREAAALDDSRRSARRPRTGASSSRYRAASGTAGEAAAAAARCEHARHAIAPGDVAAAELVHHVVAVAFEQRHQRLHPAEDACCSGDANRPTRPPSSSGLRPRRSASSAREIALNTVRGSGSTIERSCTSERK